MLSVHLKALVSQALPIAVDDYKVTGRNTASCRAVVR
jgi:hypothetical protein